MQHYTPYGWRVVVNHSTLAFNGQQYDKALDGYLLGNGQRAYKPRLMRFCSPDNLSPFQLGGINSYAYCQGDPINLIDPSGHTITRAPSLQFLAAQKLQKSPDLDKLKAVNFLSPKLMMDDYVSILNNRQPAFYTLEQLEKLNGPHKAKMSLNSAYDAYKASRSKEFSPLVIKEHRDLLISSGIDEVTMDQRNQAKNAINSGTLPTDPEVLPLYYGLLQIHDVAWPRRPGHLPLPSRPIALHGRNYQEQVNILRKK